MIVWADGAWRDADGMAPSPLDRGFALGDGLFETVLWENGRLARFTGPAARLHAGAAALGLPKPPAEADLAALAHEAAARNDLASARAAIRISWSAGMGARGLLRAPHARGALFITAAPTAAPTEPARVIWSPIRRNETAPSSRWKTLSYIDAVMARAEAHSAGFDEALMCNTQGAPVCATAANLWLIQADAILTPPVADGALPGVTRAALLASDLPIVERTLSQEDVAASAALILTNALIGVRTVSALADDVQFATAHPLIDAMRAVLARGG